MKTTQSRLWRYLALAAVVGNVAFNYLQDQLHLGGGGSIAAVTARYPNHFTPAGYAFAIWGVIYLAFLGYAASALHPSQQDVRVHDRVAPPLALANALGSAWIVAYRHEHLALSVAIILGMLGCAVAMFVCAQEGARGERPGFAWKAPFSLFLGWISVATIANVTVWLVSLGWWGAPLSPAVWAVALLGVATAIGVGLALRYGDAIVPAVIAWAAVAIAVKQNTASLVVTSAAVVAAVISALAALGGWWRPRWNLTHADATG